MKNLSVVIFTALFATSLAACAVDDGNRTSQPAENNVPTDDNVQNARPDASGSGGCASATINVVGTNLFATEIVTCGGPWVSWQLRLVGCFEFCTIYQNDSPNGGPGNWVIPLSSIPRTDSHGNRITNAILSGCTAGCNSVAPVNIPFSL